MLAQWNPVVLEAVVRASKRSAAAVHEDLKDGLYDLATIASIAPWIGIFGTVVGIMNSFQGLGTEMWAGRAAVCLGLARAVAFTGLGLLVGLIATWCYEHLSTQLHSLDQDMENASLELLNQLGRFPSRSATDFTIGAQTLDPMFGALAPEDVHREERFFRRCLFLSGAALALEWLVQFARLSFQADPFFRLTWYDAALYAGISVTMTVATMCLLLYPFWARLLHRRPGALIALGSVLALCWSLAELVLGTHLP